MLSHLRFHRRGPSNPTSPNPDPATSPSPWDPAASTSPLRPPPSFQDASSRSDGRPQSSGSSHLPPTLPPITRVTSSESEPPPLLDDFNLSASPLAASVATATTAAAAPTTLAPQQPPPPPPITSPQDTAKAQRQQPVRSPFSEDSGFMGGIALQKYRQEQQQLLHDQHPPQHPSYQQPPRRPDLVTSASTPAASTNAPKPILTSSFAATSTASSRSPPETQPVKSPYESLSSSFSPNHTRGPPPKSVPASSAAAPSPGAQSNMAQSRPATSFASPTDLHNSHHTTALPHSQSQPITGKRPVGARIATEPSNVSAVANNTISDPPKGRKGLPFLKNPVSTLLARRKTNQNAPDIAPLPLEQPPEHLVNDPRIRGTRVHDFSAPRKKKPVQSHVPEPPHGENRLELTKTCSRDTLDHGHVAYQQRHKSSASDSGQSGSLGGSSSQRLADAASIASNKTGRRASNIDRKPLPQDPPIVPPKDENDIGQLNAGSIRSASSVISKNGTTADSASLRKAAASQRMNLSREASQSGASGKDVLSAVPRHMKSTSSRFSFDMIGAAKQEKLLEERHRQRELERGPSSPEPDPNRDSRFDDFDEDGFDYDAMMDGDDDGFYEESIPEIGGDYDDMEEEPIPETRVDDFDDPTQPVSLNESADQDPDNDQENFSGFVFQRSNPASELASPRSAGLLVTPRDAEGKVIGLASWKEATPVLGAPSSPDTLPGDPTHVEEQRTQLSGDGQIAGLGIQGLDVGDAPGDDKTRTMTGQDAMPTTIPTDHGPTAPQQPRNDDLYYDGGLLDDIDEFAGNGDGSTFDESLFDLDDTDQYGRPIPGAFAAAQAAHQAAKEQEKLEQEKIEKERESKRVSDSTSRLSAQSEASPSTAHTSVSAGMQQRAQADETERDSQAISPPHAASNSLSEPAPSEQDKMAVYQAALAAAAYEAAADGRFRRDSSPPPSDIMPMNGANAGMSDYDPYKEESGLDSYEDFGDDEFGYDDMADYDLDDDAIIAEANADALASDYDGWYGSEFGFYSAPGSQRHSRDNSGGSGEKPFEFANGGYFGPSGVNRSKSGRVVSREPNLTPITERSEYSNRNSIMSLGVPPGLGSGPSSLASPGLAQLAMLSDNEDNMSLTALMKLRSRAWGGSQISLASSKEGSPRSERADGASSPWGERGMNFLGVHGHARKGSSFSVRSRDFDSSDAGSLSGSPTMAMAMPALSSPSGPPPLLSPSSSAVGGIGGLLNPTSPLSFGPSMPSPGMIPTSFESVLEAQEEPQSPEYSASISSPDTIKSPDFMQHPNLMASPVFGRPPSQQSQGSVRSARSAGSRRPGHKHKGSADSISYVQEEASEGGERRWVLEKRYTGETGEVEVEREFVQEGRI